MKVLFVTVTLVILLADSSESQINTALSGLNQNIVNNKRKDDGFQTTYGTFPLKQNKVNVLEKVIGKSLKGPIPSTGANDDVTASKRVAPAVAGALTKMAGNEKIQEAVVDKGIEVAGKLVDKQLENIEQAQQKASDFLKKEIKLDITPEKGWENEDMFVPPGYHLDAEVEAEEPSKSSEETQQPYIYPSGMGSVLMNGCWGNGYKKGDPCFDALEASEQCRDMIDGAAFIGVGFDGRGQYSPESRKMSIIQRSCAGKSSYDNLQVPDTMNVHGIYDTTASMMVFTSRSEYRTYLQREAGVSGSVFGFYAGVKSAWGSSESGSKQTNLAIFDIDVDRYEIFQDEVKPQDLSRSFLREFVGLPNSYFAPGAPAKFQEFILRWGTHYIKSARFGGQLEIRKTQLGSMTASKEEFATESESEFKGLFASGGSRTSTKSGSSSKSEKKYMSTSIVVQGGSQRIAAIISDMYAPTFKSEFTEWLESILTYPKAFKFLMGSITDLVNFRANDLFPDENIEWGCEQNKLSLKVDEKSQKSYYVVDNKRIYCEFTSREEMEFSLQRKRVSLKRAIEIYMEEGAMSISDVSLPAGKPGCETNDPRYQSATKRPSWKEMTTDHKSFTVIFDMLNSLKGVSNVGIGIPKAMKRTIQYRDDQWFTSDGTGEFHMYDGFKNGGSGDLRNKRISIFGLVLTYNEAKGSLVLDNAGYEESRKYFPGLSPLLKGKQFARAEWPIEEAFQLRVSSKNRLGHFPCNVQWSNGHRFDPSDLGGKCLHFTASSKSTLYVVFSAVPNSKDTWYYVEISSAGVGIYKSRRLMVTTVNNNAVALGDTILYQSYFVCVTESTTSTVIEYGKSQGTTDSGDVYLTMIDNSLPIHVRFYSFGNGEESAQIVDSHVVSRKLTSTDCKGDTYKDKEEPNCVQRCHEACAPLAGCQYTSQGEPRAKDCNECRVAKNRDGECVNQCRAGELPNKDKYCVLSYDLSFKSDAKSDQVKLRNLPTMSELTLCFWLRFNNFPSSYEEFDFLYYEDKATSRVKLYMHIRKMSSGKRGLYLTVLTDRGGQGTPLTFEVDDKWHHSCVARNAISGQTTLYKDGIKKTPESFMIPGLPLPAGEIQLGGFESSNFPGTITNFNIWNRMLTEEEIAKIAKSCDAGIPGTIKDWSDIISELNLGYYNVQKHSSCKIG